MTASAMTGSELSASIGGTIPCLRTSRTWPTMMTPSTSGRRQTCSKRVCPRFVTLNQAPMPTVLSPSFASNEIHWESKFV